MIHSSKYKPRIFPIKGDVDDAEMDRVQSIDPTGTLNREKVEEVGRESGIVGFLKKSPTIGYRLSQLEYGSLEFWQKIVNTTTLGSSGETGIVLNDFKTSYFDIVGYKTDDDGTFKGTMLYPALRTSGFSLTIGDPQARIERSFDFVGESAIEWQGSNKYYIYKKHDVGSGADDEIDLSAKIPAEDPDNTGTYMYRVLRVRSGVSSELTSSDYIYTPATKILKITSVVTGDVIKVWYTSATAPDVQFVLNDSDPAALIGDSVDIFLYVPASGKPTSSDKVYRLQNITLDVRLDREDVREIGNDNVVTRSVRNSTVTVTLGRFLENLTVEEVLRGVSADYGKIDIEKLTDRATIIVKIYSDNTKSIFKYGFKLGGLSPTEIRDAAAINENVKKDSTLEGEDLTISEDISVIGI